jgi:hypothetical protein
MMIVCAYKTKSGTSGERSHLSEAQMTTSLLLLLERRIQLHELLTMLPLSLLLRPKMPLQLLLLLFSLLHAILVPLKLFD